MEEMERAEELGRLAAFLVVVDSGGYSAAARRARIDKSTLSRRVRALEDALGVRLLHRTTREMRLTQAGARLVEQTRGPMLEVLRALRDASEDRASGHVHVTTVPGLNASVWAPLMLGLRQTHPELRVTLSAQMSYESLVPGGFDLGVRTGHMPDTGDIARKLARWRYVMVASPSWAAHHDALTQDAAPPEDTPIWLLQQHTARPTLWSLEREDAQRDQELTPAMMGHDIFLLRELALRGLGVFIAAPPVVAQDLEQGDLVRVFPSWRVAHTYNLYAIMPHRELLAAPVRVVLDALIERLAELELAWQTLTD